MEDKKAGTNDNKDNNKELFFDVDHCNNNNMFGIILVMKE